jgi:hypothetical protein
VLIRHRDLAVRLVNTYIGRFMMLGSGIEQFSPGIVDLQCPGYQVRVIYIELKESSALRYIIRPVPGSGY